MQTVILRREFLACSLDVLFWLLIFKTQRQCLTHNIAHAAIHLNSWLCIALKVSENLLNNAYCTAAEAGGAAAAAENESLDESEQGESAEGDDDLSEDDSADDNDDDDDVSMDGSESADDVIPEAAAANMNVASVGWGEDSDDDAQMPAPPSGKTVLWLTGVFKF